MLTNSKLLFVKIIRYEFGFETLTDLFVKFYFILIIIHIRLLTTVFNWKFVHILYYVTIIMVRISAWNIIALRDTVCVVW